MKTTFVDERAPHIERTWAYLLEDPAVVPTIFKIAIWKVFNFLCTNDLQVLPVSINSSLAITVPLNHLTLNGHVEVYHLRSTG